MDYLGQDFGLTSEYDSMSVDAIVAEFRAQQASDAAQSSSSSGSAATRRSSQEKKAKGGHLSMPSKHRNKRDKQRPKTRREEAAPQDDLEYIENEIRSAAIGTTAGTEESVGRFGASPAPVPEPVASPVGEEPPRAVTEQPREDKPSPLPTVPVAAPVAPSAPAGRHAAPETIRETSFEKSTPHAKPTDAEIREFLDAFKRGDFLDLTEHELTNPPIEPDERFYMGGEKESRIQYDGVDVDMSADENYNAPQAPDYLSSYVREEAGDKDE